MYDRKLLSALSRCAWRVLSVYLRQSVPDDSAAPGAAIAVQTFGEFQNFNPHLHAIASDGCFSDNGVFQVAPGPKPRDLEDLFRYEVLKTEGKITDAVIENMVSWRHSGFNVYCGLAIWPHDENSLENLAHYIIRAAFSQERIPMSPKINHPMASGFPHTRGYLGRMRLALSKLLLGVPPPNKTEKNLPLGQSVHRNFEKMHLVCRHIIIFMGVTDRNRPSVGVPIILCKYPPRR